MKLYPTNTALRLNDSADMASYGPYWLAETQSSTCIEKIWWLYIIDVLCSLNKSFQQELKTETTNSQISNIEYLSHFPYPFKFSFDNIHTIFTPKLFSYYFHITHKVDILKTFMNSILNALEHYYKRYKIFFFKKIMCSMLI